jgi:hypothetical protein
LFQPRASATWRTSKGHTSPQQALNSFILSFIPFLVNTFSKHFLPILPLFSDFFTFPA